MNSPRYARRKLWLLRRDRKNLRRRSRKRKRGPAGRPSIELNRYTQNSVTTEDRRFVIQLPESLDFEENYETTVSHLQALRRAVQTRKRMRSLLFNELRFISPSAALVLASEVDRWNQSIKGRIRANVPTWHEEIKQLLCEMGYFELLRLPKPTFDESSKKVVFLKFTRGDVGAPNAGALAKQFRIDVEQMAGSSIKKHFLFEGLSEAITNVGQHAYPDPATFGQWWLSASFDRKASVLCVMFYDRGVGIPTTLPRAHFFENIKALFNQWRDSEKIEAAMRGGRSATEKIERGKGLRNFIEFATSHKRGRLSIYSLRGMYRMSWKKEHSAPESTERRDYENSIGGTLIEWLITL